MDEHGNFAVPNEVDYLRANLVMYPMWCQEELCGPERLLLDMQMEAYGRLFQSSTLPMSTLASYVVDWFHQGDLAMLQHLLLNDDEGMIDRATIARGGELTERFNYLKEYASA